MHDETGWERTEAPAPVRMVHLGLGAFARAHQLWYTDVANSPVDRRAVGRRGVHRPVGRRAERSRAQDGRYTLLVRSPDGTRPRSSTPWSRCTTAPTPPRGATTCAGPRSASSP